MSDDAADFTARISGATEDENGELVAPGRIYATIHGQRRAIALEFIWKDGASLTIPYSHAPLLWWTPPGLITIEYPGLISLELGGTELDELHRALKDHRVTWVREFDDHQAAALASAVTRITIIQAYPSRETVDRPGDGVSSNHSPALVG